MRRPFDRRAVLGLGASLLGGCLRLTTQTSDGTTTSASTITTNSGATTKSAMKTTRRSTTTTEADSTSATTDDSTTTGQQENVEYPTGVTEDQVSPRVVFDHRSKVSANSCTVTTTEDRGYGSITTTRKLAATSKAYVVESEGPAEIEKWLANGERVMRGSMRGQTIYGYTKKHYFDREMLTATVVLRKLLETGAYKPTGTTSEDGTVYITFAAEEKATNSIAEWWGREKVTGFEGSGRVTEDGLIRELTATYTLEGEFETETYRTKIETENVGNTNVSKPTWVPTAKERAPKVEASFVDDGKFVELVHVGGVGIPFETFVAMHPIQGRDSYRAEIPNGIGEGETLYLYKEGEERLGFSRGAKPDVAPPPFESGMEIEVRAEVIPILETELPL